MHNIFPSTNTNTQNVPLPYTLKLPAANCILQGLAQVDKFFRVSCLYNNLFLSEGMQDKWPQHTNDANTMISWSVPALQRRQPIPSHGGGANPRHCFEMSLQTLYQKSAEAFDPEAVYGFSAHVVQMRQVKWWKDIVEWGLGCHWQEPWHPHIWACDSGTCPMVSNRRSWSAPAPAMACSPRASSCLRQKKSDPNDKHAGEWIPFLALWSLSARFDCLSNCNKCSTRSLLQKRMKF